MSNGMVVALSDYQGGGSTQFALTLNNGTSNFTLATSSAGNGYGGASASGMGWAMWEVVYGGVSYLVVLSNFSSVNVINVWKCAVGVSPVQVTFNQPCTTLNPYGGGALGNINGLRRVFSYNGSFYLGDIAPASPTVSNRNSMMLTPFAESFTFTPAYLYTNGDTNPTGLANVYSTQYSATTVNPTAVPSVFVAGSAANTFTKVK